MYVFVENIFAATNISNKCDNDYRRVENFCGGNTGLNWLVYLYVCCDYKSYLFFIATQNNAITSFSVNT